MILLAWVPLPLGSNRTWSKAVLIVFAAVLVILSEFGRPMARASVQLPRRLVVAGLLFLAVLAWGWVQGSARVPAAWAHPLWADVMQAGLPARLTMSLDPAATRAGLLLLASYGLLFWTAFRLGQNARLAYVLMTGLVVISTGWAVWGLVRFVGGFDLLFFAGEPASGGVSANFPNRNHFATYANLAFLLIVARLSQRLLQPNRQELRIGTVASEGLRYLLEQRARWFMAGMVLLIASLGTASRGGFLSLIVAFMCLLILVARRTGIGLRRVWLALAAAGVLFIGAVPLAGSVLLERLNQFDVVADVEGAGRLAGWEVALRLLEQRPWLGQGYGTFVRAFPIEADERFAVYAGSQQYLLSYDYAHNTHLENAVELGLPATGVLYLAVGLMASLCLRRDDKGRTSPLPLAAVAGTVLVTAHALVDFSIQIPAVAASYAVILGLGCGQAVATGGDATTQRRQEMSERRQRSMEKAYAA